MNYRLTKLNDADGRLDKQWFVYFYYRHPETGSMTRFRKWISIRIKTKSGRRQKASELKKIYDNKLKQGWNPFQEEEVRLTGIEDALDFALKYKKATRKKRTYQTYSSVIGMFKKYLKRENLLRISSEEMNAKIAQGFLDHGLLVEGISARTHNNRLWTMSGTFALLKKRGYVFHNPFSDIENLPEAEPEIVALNKDELTTVAEKLPKFNYELYVISNLIFYCFIRPAEIVRLEFQHILWDLEIIIVPGVRTKNNKSRVVIIPEAMKKNLKDWDLNYPSGYHVFSKGLKPGTKEIAPTRIAEFWKIFADEIKLDKHIYDMKHTGNGMAFDQKLSIRDIQLQDGHSSLDYTQKYLARYRRIASDDFKKNFAGY